VLKRRKDFVDGMSLPLSRYWDNAKQRKHVLRAENTANLILKLWKAGQAGRTPRRKHPEFLAMLVRCGWNNESNGGEGAANQLSAGGTATWLMVSDSLRKMILRIVLPDSRVSRKMLRSLSEYKRVLRIATVPFALKP
jgi:hypothetical protein